MSSRKVTNAVLEMVEEGLLDPMQVLRSCLVYMSEAEVADMARCEGLIEDEDDAE